MFFKCNEVENFNFKPSILKMHFFFQKRDTCQIILPLPNPNPSTSILVADKTVVGHFLVGTALPANANVSNSVQVNVLKRKIDRPSSKTLFGMEWEPWFTPLNINVSSII